MAKRTTPRAAMALLALAGLAWAQQAWVPLEQRLGAARLREVGLTPTQLELLDRYLREAEENAPQVEAAAGGPDPARFIGVDAERIDSRAKGIVAGWEPGSVFELDNGQQWKVLKGSMKLRKPLQEPQVVLVPGVAGRWFLQVDEDLPKARVYRID